jgi:DNA-binding LacI/PurR family transcriptional regulator
MARTTLDDVAKQAGVSFKTVSRVLNNEHGVSKTTTEKVRKAIAELNYVPNIAARTLSRGKARAIGLVIGWPVTSPFSTTMIEDTLRESMRHGYSLALFSLDHGSSKRIIDAFLGRQVDGLILDTVAFENIDLVEQLNLLHVPCVVVHPNQKKNYPGASFVQIDNVAAARQAVSYLLALGHRSIGFVNASVGLLQEDERYQGYREAFAEMDLPFNRDWVFGGEGWAPEKSFHSGFAGAMHLLSKNKELTALFAHTDEIAMGCASAIWQMGLRIPDDISLIGFDDIVFASMIAPPLTTIHQPIDEFMRISVEHLIGLIEGTQREPIDMILPTRLVVRETCRPPKREEVAA